MKYLLIILVGLFAGAVAGQPIVKADAAVLLREMPAPPTTLAEAFQRSYPNGGARPDAQAYYRTVLDKLTGFQQESQQLSLRFYQQHPTGVVATPPPAGRRVSAQDQAAMQAATQELAQKMQADPAFARQFTQMSEAEQQAYLTKLLAAKGIQPASGTPNTNDAPMAGTDVEWITLCNDYTQAMLAAERWEKQTALQQRYAAQHQAVDEWTTAEIRKLPMIEMGEYGHDHDPESVKALRKQGLDKHRRVADAMMHEAAELFAQFRREAGARSQGLNEAFRKAGYGQTYSFGLHYPQVLQTQGMLFSDLQALLTNETGIIEEVAKWEYEWKNLQ